MIKIIFIAIVILLSSDTFFCQSSPLKQNRVTQQNNVDKTSTKIDTQKIELIFSKEFLKVIEENIQHKEEGFLNKYGTLIVAIVALLGTLITTLIGTRQNRINLERQLSCAESNLSKQIQSSKDLEYDKKNIEEGYIKINSIKKMIAKFIELSESLNRKLNNVIDYHIAEQRLEEAKREYKDTFELRTALRSIYYELKLTLDNSASHKKIEKITDNYMDMVDFKINLKTIRSSVYVELIDSLYNEAKSLLSGISKT